MKLFQIIIKINALTSSSAGKAPVRRSLYRPLCSAFRVQDRGIQDLPHERRGGRVREGEGDLLRHRGQQREEIRYEQVDDDHTMQRIGANYLHRSGCWLACLFVSITITSG